jgi:hypothetical protein
MVFSGGTGEPSQHFRDARQLRYVRLSHFNPRLLAPSLPLQTSTLEIIPEFLRCNIEFIWMLRGLYLVAGTHR